MPRRKTELSLAPLRLECPHGDAKARADIHFKGVGFNFIVRTCGKRECLEPAMSKAEGMWKGKPFTITMSFDDGHDLVLEAKWRLRKEATLTGKEIGVLLNFLERKL